jgi:hypothetical protein
MKMEFSKEDFKSVNLFNTGFNLINKFNTPGYDLLFIDKFHSLENKFFSSWEPLSPEVGQHFIHFFK